MLWVLIGIVVFVVASLIIAGHEHIEKKKDDAARIQSNRQNVTKNKDLSDIQDMEMYENDHLDD